MEANQDCLTSKYPSLISHTVGQVMSQHPVPQPILEPTTSRKTIPGWIATVRERQRQMLTPEKEAEIKRESERLQRVSKLNRRAKIIHGSSSMSTRVWSATTAAMDEDEEEEEDLLAHSANSAPVSYFAKSKGRLNKQRMKRKQGPVKKKQSSLRPSGLSKDYSKYTSDAREELSRVQQASTMSAIVTSRALDDMDDMDDDLMQDRNQLLEVNDMLMELEEAAPLIESEMTLQSTQQREELQEQDADVEQAKAEALEQVKIEPNNDEERAAKYAIFETYLETVVNIREETLKFWEESKQEFPERAQHSIQRQIQNLDRDVNQGVDFEDTRFWFVYQMLKKVMRNQTLINDTLLEIRRRLSLLGQQEDCPVCFDKFDATRPATTLGCCHKVCTECWEQWSQMQHGHAFCPLCRHREFLRVIMTHE